MHIYEDHTGCVRLGAWNAVDVLVDGGLQYGHITNVVEGGLIIDFGCATQRMRFVEYQNIFNSQTANFVHPLPGEEAQVLLRHRPDSAWAWYSGARLSASTANGKFVEVHLPHGTTKELVPSSQVRPLALSPTVSSFSYNLRVREKDFVVRSCSLPADFWSRGSRVLRETFKHLLNSEHKVLCTLLSQMLLYLQRGTDTPLQPDTVEALYLKAKDYEKIGRTPLWILEETETKEPDRKRKTCGKRNIGLPLSVELLVEIFQSLDSINRFRCRRTCGLWNRILTTAAYFPDVCVVCYAEEEDCLSSAVNAYFSMASCLLKCTDTHTKTLVFAHMDWPQLLNASSVLESDICIPKIIFYHCSFGEYNFDWGSMVVDEIATMCGTFDAVVLKKCHLSELSLSATILQHSFCTQSPERLREQLWDLFENNLNLEEPINQTALREKIANCTDSYPIVPILETFQKIDPRLSLLIVVKNGRYLQFPIWM
ncbi:uncharacterized protein LOC129597203 [Paramacrobiotus metropolitanus]|uniref:uncharacterized protein LOC129597203 n=1 Tax=Paramacrobiotus metropolitanus TaxID=2943436 RepID=UPI0024464B7B|nr:uncharacterized protein LOC129597203 [Paramacrobiotus metropolitanus]